MMKYYIDGCEIKSVMRVPMRSDGSYVVRFPHDALLSQLEAINWDKPTIVLNEPRDTNKAYLPTGCGFLLDHLTYSSRPREWTAEIRMGEQYLVDASAIQAQVDALEADVEEKNETIAQQQDTIEAQTAELAAKDLEITELEAGGTAAAETQLQEAYKEGVESIG